MKPAIAAFLLAASIALAAPPRDSAPLDAAEVPLNFRLHVEFSAPSEGVVRLGKGFAVPPSLCGCRAARGARSR